MCRGFESLLRYQPNYDANDSRKSVRLGQHTCALAELRTNQSDARLLLGDERTHGANAAGEQFVNLRGGSLRGRNTSGRAVSATPTSSDGASATARTSKLHG